MPPLPGPLRVSSSFDFVGRSHELGILRDLLATADGDGGRVAVLSGQSGSGKSRLLRELAQEAAADGFLVLYGACDAAVRAPHGPFVMALEQLERATSPDELRVDLGTGGGELTRLLPDLALRVGELPPPAPGEPPAERHRLHTAVLDLFATVSRRAPILLVIDDAHWADTPTLLLLCHLTRFAGDCRMVLVASFEDRPGPVGPELAAALTDLRRVEGGVRLQLSGLNEAEVADFVRRAAGTGLDPTLRQVAHAIGKLTDGNPFLITEVWRTLIETGVLEVEDGGAALTRPLDELESPQNVRDVVRGRLSRLADCTVEILEAAAVAGPEFTLDVVRAAADVDGRSILVALDEAARAGIVERVAGEGPVYRFTHDLVRRAIYDQLTALGCAELHLRVGTALEDALGESGTRALAEVAHHLAAASPLGDVERAVDYNLRLARSAVGALAFEQAAAHLRTALRLGIADPAERAHAQVVLGHACNAAGSAIDAIEAYTAAADLARGVADPELLARAAIGLEDACWRPGITHPDTLEMLEEAIAALGEGDSTLRVGLLSALARLLAARGEHARAGVVRTSATAMARRLGDRRALANLLVRAPWARGSTSLEEILDMLGEARDLGDELGDLEIQDGARAWRVITCMALGDVGVAQRELAALLHIAERARQPFLLSSAEHIAAAIALLQGNLEEAETRAERSRDAEPVLSGRDTSAIHGIQMFSVRREQGRLSELAPLLRLLADGDKSPGAWRPGLVALLVELGMHDEARRELESVSAQGLGPYREALWTASLTYLTDACAALGDEQVAAVIRPELEPYAGSGIVVGHGVAFYGAADRYLGMLSATMGDWDEAAQRFDAALAFNRRMGADTWLAHTAYEYGRMLRRRGCAEDAGQASSLIDEATTLAERIGMPALLSRIAALDSPPGGSPLPDGLSPREVEILRLVTRGLSNRQIGQELVISEHTAANHMRSILRKTSCANRTEAADYAHRHGLATSGERA